MNSREICYRIRRIAELSEAIEKKPDLAAPGHWGKKEIIKICNEIQENCRTVEKILDCYGEYDTVGGSIPGDDL